MANVNLTVPVLDFSEEGSECSEEGQKLDSDNDSTYTRSDSDTEIWIVGIHFFELRVISISISDSVNRRQK